jgi:diacylglycerol kinase (ATP)
MAVVSVCSFLLRQGRVFPSGKWRGSHYYTRRAPAIVSARLSGLFCSDTNAGASLEGKPVNKREQIFSVGGRLRSFQHALRGIAELLGTQHNAWIHALATLAVVIFGWALGVSALEWCALVLAMMVVWVAEALNTAFEYLCDVVSPDYHPLVGKAKDIAAGAVLMSAIGAAMVGLIIFLPRLSHLF